MYACEPKKEPSQKYEIKILSSQDNNNNFLISKQVAWKPELIDAYLWVSCQMYHAKFVIAALELITCWP